MLNVQEKMEKHGWTFSTFYCYKKTDSFEVDIEFCIGDYCVGAYDENLNLLEPKIRNETFIQAYLNAIILLEKYGQPTDRAN